MLKMTKDFEKACLESKLRVNRMCSYVYSKENNRSQRPELHNKLRLHEKGVYHLKNYVTVFYGR